MDCPKTIKHIVTLSLGAFFALGCGFCYAQRPMDLNPNSFRNQYGMPGMNPGSAYGNNIPGVIDNEEEAVQDTVQKPPKVRKPLESYFFVDSIREKNNFVWSIKPGYNDIVLSDVDTTLNGFQNEYPYIRNNVGSAYLGNLGAAAVPLDYSLRPRMRNFEFARSFDTYMTTPERARFFNTKRPLTQTDYYFAGQTRRMEEHLHIVHAQNISPTSGFNIEYSSMGTRGIYTHQKSRDKNLSLAFSHTGKKYTIHAGYIYNAWMLNENGGIADDGQITDTVLEMPELVQVRMTTPKNTLKNNTFYVSQSYGVPLRRLTDEDFSIADRPSVFVGHMIQYDRFFKSYTDDRNGTGNYYNNWYINPNSTHDSIFESRLSNRLFVQIQPWDRNSVVGVINGGVGYDAHYYYNFTMNDYLQGEQGVKKNSTYVYGSINGKISRYFDWDGRIEYHPVGYRAQDIDIGGGVTLSAFIKDRPITLKANLEHTSLSPGYWTDNYFSNHYVWNNSFSKEDETRFSATLNVPMIGMELGAWHSINTGKIYYGADMLPAQYSGDVNVTGLYARKDFRLGGLHLNHRVLFQSSSNQEVIPVPKISAYLSYYYQFSVVKDVLTVQLGVDGRYFTKYYAFGYNPATAQFYNQREKKLGDYPFLDAFLAAKWKRMRILLKFQHVNENLFGDRNYFNVLHYPLNKRVLKFGLSWTFYD